MSIAKDLIKLYKENISSAGSDVAFISLVSTLLDNNVINLDEPVEKSYFEEEKDISLREYIKKKSLDGASVNDFLIFINKYCPEIRSKKSIIKSFNELLSSTYTEKNENACKEILASLTKDEFIDLLMVREKEKDEDLYNSYTLTESFNDYKTLLNNVFIQIGFRDLVIEKLDGFDLFFKNPEFGREMSQNFLRYLNKNYTNDELLNKYIECQGDDKETQQKPWLNYLLELSSIPSRFISEESLCKKESIREYIYKDLYPLLSNEDKETLYKELPLYIKSKEYNDNNEFVEIIDLPEWYNNKTTFDIVLKSLILKENNGSCYLGFSGLIEKIKTNEEFKNFLLTNEDTLFNKVLSIDRGAHNIYLDKAFLFTNKEKIKPASKEELFSMDKKLSKLVTRYGVDMLLGSVENQKEAIDFLSSWKFSSSSYSSSKEEKKFLRIVEEFKTIQQKFGEQLSPCLNQTINWCSYIKMKAIDKINVALPEELPSEENCMNNYLYKEYKYSLKQVIETEFKSYLEKRELKKILTPKIDIENNVKKSRL